MRENFAQPVDNLFTYNEIIEKADFVDVDDMVVVSNVRRIYRRRRRGLRSKL